MACFFLSNESGGTPAHPHESHHGADRPDDQSNQLQPLRGAVQKSTGILPIEYRSLARRAYTSGAAPLLTQNRIGVGISGWTQRKIRRANDAKSGKSEPKRLRFFFGTTYGPEGRGFESLTACHSAENPQPLVVAGFPLFARASGFFGVGNISLTSDI